MFLYFVLEQINPSVPPIYCFWDWKALTLTGKFVPLLDLETGLSYQTRVHFDAVK